MVLRADAHTSSALATANTIIRFGLVRIEIASTYKGNACFGMLRSILRILVSLRVLLARKCEEIVERQKTAVCCVACFTVAVSGIGMAACDAYSRLARLIPRILFHRTSSSCCVIFVLQCRVASRVLSRCDCRFELSAVPAYSICSILR